MKGSDALLELLEYAHKPKARTAVHINTDNLETASADPVEWLAQE